MHPDNNPEENLDRIELGPAQQVVQAGLGQEHVVLGELGRRRRLGCLYAGPDGLEPGDVAGLVLGLGLLLEIPGEIKVLECVLEPLLGQEDAVKGLFDLEDDIQSQEVLVGQDLPGFRSGDPAA